MNPFILGKNGQRSDHVKLRVLGIVGCWVFAALAPVRAAPTAQSSMTASLQDLCAQSPIKEPELSPDGTRVIFLTPNNGSYSVAQFNLLTGKADILVRAKSGDITVAFWKGNDRIVYGGNSVPSGTGFVFGGDFKVLASLALEGKDKGRTVELTVNMNPWEQVFDTLESDPRHMIVYANKMARIDVETSEAVVLEPENPYREAYSRYVMDQSGVFRLRLHYLGNKLELQHRRTDRENFANLLTWDTTDPAIKISGFAADDNLVYCITAEDGDSGVLHALDTRTGKFGPAIVTVPGAEMTDVIFSRDHSRVLGVWVEKEAPTAIWTDDAMKRVQATIDASLAGRQNTIVSSSTDGLVHLVLSATPRDPGIYYVLDLRRKALMPLGKINPRLDPARMGDVTAHEIKAADGFTVHAILTLPKGGTGPVPMIVIPESPPFGRRFTRQYDFRSQVFASWGYAVLQVDYRGTGGYGRAYHDAGKREFVGRVPEDIDDAVRWAVASGYAQKDRICIFGSGYYGGELALMGAVFEAGTYCCAINEDGEPDSTLIAARKYDYRDWYESWIRESMGLDVGQLEKRSPIHALKGMKTPLLNIYQDPNANEQWGRLETALKRAHADYSLLTPFVYGKGQDKSDQLVDLYSQVGAFLAKNMPASTGRP